MSGSKWSAKKAARSSKNPGKKRHNSKDQHTLDWRNQDINIRPIQAFQIMMFMIDFSSFDIMLLHLKLQTCFFLPGLISTIRSLQKFH